MARKNNNKNTFFNKVKNTVLAFSILYALGFMLSGSTNKIEPTPAAQFIIAKFEQEKSNDKNDVSETPSTLFTQVDESYFKGDLKYLNSRMPTYAHTNKIYKRDSTFYIEVVCVFKADAVRLASRKAERRMRCVGK